MVQPFQVTVSSKEETSNQGNLRDIDFDKEDVHSLPDDDYCANRVDPEDGLWICVSHGNDENRHVYPIGDPKFKYTVIKEITEDPPENSAFVSCPICGRVIYADAYGVYKHDDIPHPISFHYYGDGEHTH